MRILNINDADFAQQLIAAIGTESVQVMLPSFDREDGRAITYIPSTKDEFEAMRDLFDADALKAVGCQRWDEGLWLFPFEWYSSIPAGLLVTNIFGKTEPFSVSTHSNDRRIGALAYGFRGSK